MQRSIRVLLTASLALGAAASAVQAQNIADLAAARHANPAPAVEPKWKESLDAFAAADKLDTPRTGGVLFVGSSSIRMWNDLEQQFDTLPIVKRGFGGSRMSDCARYLSQLVLPYQPRLVIVYAGENDLAEGATPQDVLESFKIFVEGVQADLPHTRIAFLSIKPSPLRESIIPFSRDANTMIAGYIAGKPNLDYIDVFSKMMGPDGRPRAELFLPDRLHMNQAGYALWKSAITKHLGNASFSGAN